MSYFQRRVPYISQMEHSECGLACLAMVLNFYKHEIRLSDIREEIGSSSSGYSFFDLYMLAVEKNMEVMAFKLEPSSLAELKLPLILHWKDNHYVVLEKVIKNKFYILDPSTGRKTMNFEQFSEDYSGSALQLIPLPNFNTFKKKKTHFIVNYMNSQKKFIFFAILVTLVMQFLAILIPLLTQWYTDTVLMPKNNDYIGIVGVGILSIFISYTLIYIVRGFLIAKLQSKLDSFIMSKFMNILLRLPYLYFNNRSSGDLLFRANSNTLIKQLLSTTVISVFIDILLVFSYIFIMFYYSIPLSFTLLLIGLVIIVFLILNTKIISKLSDKNVSHQSEVQSVLSDSIKGITDIKMLGLEEKMFNNWFKKFSLQIKSTENLNIWSSIIQSFTSGLQMIVSLFMLWIGGIYLIRGEISIGTLLAFSTISVSFIQPIVSLSGSYSQIITVRSYFQRIIDVIETKPETNCSDNVKKANIHGEIKLQNVHFKYSRFSKEVIKNFTLSIKPNETIAIVGASGSGKSTIAKLLLGFYFPTKGNILFDNNQITDYNITALRQQIGSVIQESRLFNRTIFENINMLQQNITIEDVIEACKKANIYDEIMQLPMNFNTIISEDGSNFSGGQIQRLLIARALVNPKPILIFDEASSALDNISEKVIYDNLFELSCTKIIIAHRLSTIKNADRIVVMSDGEIVEIGSHESLISQKGHYYKLYNTNKILV